MTAHDLSDRMRQGLRVLLAVSLAALAGLLLAAVALRWDREVRNLDDLRAQGLLTCVSLALAAWLGGIQARALPFYPRRATVLLAAIILSQACFLLLVWTPLKASSTLWRVWWVAMIGSVTTTHIILLRAYATSPGRLLERATAICAVAAALLLMGLAFRQDLVAPAGKVFWNVFAVPAVLAAAGSVAVWWRWRRRDPAAPIIPRWWKITGLVASQPALVLTAFYVGRLTAPTPNLLDWLPSTLAHLSPEELDAQVRTDLERLRKVSAGVDEFGEKFPRRLAELQARREAEKRNYYLPEEEDRLRAEQMSYLAYRTVLLRLVANYAGFEAVRDPQARARCFLIGYAASTTLFQADRRLVAAARGDALLRRKLNEPDRGAGIPGGMFDRIAEDLASERVRELCEEMAAYYEHKRDEWRAAGLFTADDLAWLEGRIDSGIAEVRTAGGSHARASLERFMARVRNDTYTPVYAAQSLAATWIGDTRLLQRSPCVTLEQIRQMQGELQPGDILLERRNWFLSNAFLPGFWPHAALYVGTPEDLEQLGVLRRENGSWTSDHVEVREHLAEYLKKAPDGEPHTVIEAVSEGVIVNSLTESMHADYVAVLRPRLSAEDRARAIVRAFGHVGKPYDFDFDFTSADKLVCSELVYRVYDGMLHFKLVRIMGRDTLPALEIARKFAEERGRPGQELDFVLFLDSHAGDGRCRLAGPDEFCASIDRPRGFRE